MKYTLLGAVALSLLAGIALANEPYLPRNQNALQRLDANKDGRISLDEIKPRLRQAAWRWSIPMATK